MSQVLGLGLRDVEIVIIVFIVVDAIADERLPLNDFFILGEAEAYKFLVDRC